MYGVWILAAATIGIFSLVDVGAAAATGRLVAHAAARRDHCIRARVVAFVSG